MGHIRSILNLNSAAGNGSPSCGYPPALAEPSQTSGSPSWRRSNRHYSLASPRALCLATVFGALALPVFISSAHAIVNNTGATDSISLSIESQCSFMTKGAASAADGSYRATGANGTDATFADGNNTRTFNIACNQISGYTVEAYTTELTKEGGSDVLAFVDYANYASTKSGTPGVGIWSAELVDADSGATFGTQASPNVIKHTTEASNVNGDEFSVNYMAYIGRTTPSGTYIGEAVYTLSGNPLVTDYNWYVYYHTGIAGTDATGMPADQSGTSELEQDTTVTLSTTIPTATIAGQVYNFLGWDTDAAATTVVYNAGQQITILESNPAVNLYAVWEPVTAMANGATMQSMSVASCANVEKYSVSGTTYQLVDSRDSHSYLVRKLEDGNCWMVQNLSLYAKTTITADDTDLNGTDTENNTFISNWNNATSVSAGSGTWTDNATKYQVYNGTYQANTKNTTVSSHYTPTSNTGSYYPFIIATAGYDVTASTNGQQAGNSSICPKGWKLPTGGSSGQFNTLYTTGYSSNSGNFQSAMNIDNAYPSYCYFDYCPSANNITNLWSSTIRAGSDSYILRANPGYVYPTYSSIKHYGFSVRCVLTTTPYNYTLSFDANGGDGAPSAITGTSSSVSDRISLTIPDTTPTRDGYSFLGWSTEKYTATATYQPGDTITVSSSAFYYTLYAVWQLDGSSFQTFSASDCSNISTGSTIPVQDTRDGRVYLVSRLADNHCWMVQNLALAPGTTITSTDSDVSSNYTIPENTEFSPNTSYGSSTDEYYEKESAILPSGDSGYIAATRNGYNASGSADNTKNTGAYYSYNVAVAGTNKGSGNRGAYAPASICPKGWRLPTYDEYYTLWTSSYSSNVDNFKNVWGSALVGLYVNGSLGSSGSASNWWSGTRLSDYGVAYHLYMNARNVTTTFNNGRYYGCSVRCIFGSR